MLSYFKEFKADLSASIIVFLVALPLCLGIALASGAPLFSGIIAGIVGGIIVGLASGSPLGVSGPAAGLTVIVFTAIHSLGAWPVFLLAVVISGVIQLLMGYAKTGFIAGFVPSSVIKGMLAGIGILIILKQIPHALGYDKDGIGDLAFLQVDGDTTLSAIQIALQACTVGAALIAAVSLFILILWEMVLMKKHRIFHIIQGPMVVVLGGVFINLLYRSGYLPFSLSQDQLVNLPVADSFSAFVQQFTYPDFSSWNRIEVWKTGFVIAIVGSLETLLCVEATDKLDLDKRVTPKNRELKAQGLGNLISGLLGGLPVTQVIVRSSANITFGAKTKLSAILHGFFLLIAAAFVAKFLNLIPLASLAAILMMVGYKLTKPSLIRAQFALGWEQFLPFIATIAGLLLTDLLKGIIIGMCFGVFFTLQHSYRNAYYMKDKVTNEDGHSVHHIVLAEEVSFFNKPSIVNALDSIPSKSTVIIDCSNSKSIDYDVVEYIQDFMINAKYKDIAVKTIAFRPTN